MIFDTLFALDANLKLQPQMVDKYTVSKDAHEVLVHAARRPQVPRRRAGDRRGLRGLAQALGRQGRAWASS